MSILAHQKQNDQTVEFRPAPESLWVPSKQANDVAKRVIDLVGASCAVLILSPIMLVVALLIRLTSPGPVIFRQKRLGYQGRVFSCYKFRTMHKNAEARQKELDALNEQTAGVLFTMKKDPRITPIGKFLRRTSLDELPQFFNVILGDMSLVGPRPALFNQDDLIALRTEKNVHLMVPGLTGWAQINGRDELPIPDKVVLDTFYLEHQTFLLDLRILLLTLFKVIKRDGVSH